MGLRQVPVKQKIESSFHDIDGYWVYLRDGWQNRYNPGCHIITEDTRAKALSVARDAIPCECAECVERTKP
jgi:hypothetical protein